MLTDPSGKSKDSFSHNLDNILSNDEKIGHHFKGTKSAGEEWNYKFNPTSSNGQKYPRKVYMFEIPDTTHTKNQVQSFVKMIYDRMKEVSSIQELHHYHTI